jgi:heme A synthase
MLIEFTHRITSGMALLLVAGLFVWARLARPAGHPARRGAGFALAFMIAEALIGAGLVLLALVAKDASLRRVVALALHLVNTFLLLASLGATAFFATQASRPRQPARPIPGLLYPALVGTLLIGVTGAMTALGDTLFPAANLIAGLEQDRSPAAHVLLRLRVLHPALALFTSVYLAVAVSLLLHRSAAVRLLGRATIVLFVVQVGAGVTNLVLLAPVYMQLVHLLLADLVWLALVLTTVACTQAD